MSEDAGRRPVTNEDHYSTAKRTVLQTIAGTFPGNALKFTWTLVPSQRAPSATMRVTSLGYTLSVCAQLLAFQLEYAVKTL